MKPKRRAAYSEGALYSIVLCLPAVVLSLFLLSKVYDIKRKVDPIGIVIAVGYIVLYLVLFKYGRNLFRFTEKMYMSCGDYYGVVYIHNLKEVKTNGKNYYENSARRDGRR